MKREIKFRALKDDISNRTFKYGQLVYDAIGRPRITEVDSSGEGLTFHTCINGTESQFIGLIDISGREIYEGDVYKRVLDKTNRYKKDYEWADYWLVHWIKEDACFTTTCIADNDNFGKFKLINGWASKSNPYSKRFKEFDEYIGNIYETPELLTCAEGEKINN